MPRRPPISACSSARTTTCRRSRCASARRPRTSASSAWCSANAAMPGASPTASSNTLAGPLDFLDPRLSDPAAHLRIHLGPDRAGQAALRQVEERSHPADFPRFLQRRARLAHGRSSRAGSSKFRARCCARSATTIFDMAPDTIRESTFCCGGGGGLAHRRIDGRAHQGRAAAHARAAAKSPRSTASPTWRRSARSARRNSRRSCRNTASTWRRSSACTRWCRTRSCSTGSKQAEELDATAGVRRDGS